MRSYVYFFFSDDKVKIGKANDVVSRLKSVRTHCPSKVKHLGHIECESERLAFELEKELHEKYDQYRENGEWFFISKYEAHDIIRDYSKTVPSGFIQHTESDSISLLDGLNWIGRCYYRKGENDISVEVFEDNYNTDYIIGVETVYGQGKVNVSIEKHPYGLPDHYKLKDDNVRRMKSLQYENDTIMRKLLDTLVQKPFTIYRDKDVDDKPNVINGFLKKNKRIGEIELYVSAPFFNDITKGQYKIFRKRLLENGFLEYHKTRGKPDKKVYHVIKMNGKTYRTLKVNMDFVEKMGYDFTTKL